jgi:hypothetical protein
MLRVTLTPVVLLRHESNIAQGDADLFRNMVTLYYLVYCSQSTSITRWFPFAKHTLLLGDKDELHRVFILHKFLMKDRDGGSEMLYNPLCRQ